MYVMNDSLMKY